MLYSSRYFIHPPEVFPLQKRSHRLLASALLTSHSGFSARRYEWAFLFGSFQPDCNPLTYLKGSRRAEMLRGHNFSNSRPYICRRIRALQSRRRWTIWHYYTLGKLTHYLADAFTWPHNDTFSESLMVHRRYEHDLRLYLAEYLPLHIPRHRTPCSDLTDALEELHRQYTACAAGMGQDVRYTLQALELLMSLCRPASC